MALKEVNVKRAKNGAQAKALEMANVKRVRGKFLSVLRKLKVAFDGFRLKESVEALHSLELFCLEIFIFTFASSSSSSSSSDSSLSKKSDEMSRLILNSCL